MFHISEVSLLVPQHLVEIGHDLVLLLSMGNAEPPSRSLIVLPWLLLWWKGSGTIFFYWGGSSCVKGLNH